MNIEIPDGYIKCSSCKIYKPTEDFGANKAKYNGLNSNCKECNKLQAKKNSKLKSQNRKLVTVILNKALHINEMLDDSIEAKFISDDIKSIIDYCNNVLNQSKILGRDLATAENMIHNIENIINKFNKIKDIS